MKKISLEAILLAALTLVMANATAADDKPDVMMTGTIVAVQGDELKIRTADVGVQTFKFKEGVERPANLAVGTNVTVWVDPDDADDNPPGEKIEKETYTIHRIQVAAAEPPKTAAPPPAQTQAPPPVERQPAAPPAEETAPQEELPATASPLPAIGILGLLAIAGGLTLRMKRHARSM